MKKLLFFIQVTVLSTVTFGQQEIKNAENFSEGTVLKFQNCISENVSVGKPGKKQTWDFSKLIIKEGDATTEDMILPSNVGFTNDFPKANLVERYSDGRFVFMEKTATENYLLGFVDTASQMSINYLDPMLFAKRPLNYGDVFTDEYGTEFSLKGMDFKGKGTATITVDGYGTLILPNGKYENVLRVKIAQTQTDKIIQYQSENVTETVTYVWFDANHASALLKIDDTKSTYYNEKSVQFLLSETNMAK